MLALLLAISALSSCSTKPEYIYIQPECNVVGRKTLPELDSGIIYSVLGLPHLLHPKDLSELLPELPSTYDGHELYYQLVEREGLIVDMLIENEVIVEKVCGIKKD